MRCLAGDIHFTLARRKPRRLSLGGHDGSQAASRVKQLFDETVSKRNYQVIRQ